MCSYIQRISIVYHLTRSVTLKLFDLRVPILLKLTEDPKRFFYVYIGYSY